MDFSEIIRREIASRVEAGESLREIARQSGLTQPVVSRFVSGKASLKLDSAEKLCYYLGLELRRRKPSEQASK